MSGVVADRPTRGRRGACTPWRVVAVLLTLLPVTLLLVAGPAAAAAPAAPSYPCFVELTQAQQFVADVRAHNDRNAGLNPYSAGAVAAYNAEAAALEARRAVLKAELARCIGDSLGDGASAQSPSPAAAAQVQAAGDRIRSTYTAPPAPGTGHRWTLLSTPQLRELYSTLRAHSARRSEQLVLQGQPRPAAGDPDPVFPGAVIAGSPDGAPDVHQDHVLPIVEIMNLDGFLELSGANMLRVVNSPLNLQWLSPAADLAKSSPSAASAGGVDPLWQAQQRSRESQVRNALREDIRALVLLQSAVGK